MPADRSVRGREAAPVTGRLRRVRRPPGSPAGTTCATRPTWRIAVPRPGPEPSWPNRQRPGVEDAGRARSNRAEGTQQARVAQSAGGTPFRAVTVRVRIALRVRHGRKYGLVAHREERPSCKRKVAGSSPAGSTGPHGAVGERATLRMSRPQVRVLLRARPHPPGCGHRRVRRRRRVGIGREPPPPVTTATLPRSRRSMTSPAAGGPVRGPGRRPGPCRPCRSRRRPARRPWPRAGTAPAAARTPHRPAARRRPERR